MLPLHYATFFDVVPVMEILLMLSGSAGILVMLLGVSNFLLHGLVPRRFRC